MVLSTLIVFVPAVTTCCRPAPAITRSWLISERRSVPPLESHPLPVLAVQAANWISSAPNAGPGAVRQAMPEQVTLPVVIPDRYTFKTGGLTEVSAPRRAVPVSVRAVSVTVAPDPKLVTMPSVLTLQGAFTVRTEADVRTT